MKGILGEIAAGKKLNKAVHKVSEVGSISNPLQSQVVPESTIDAKDNREQPKPVINATQEELVRIELELNKLKQQAELIRATLNPEEKKQAEQLALQERQETCIEKIVSVSNQSIKPKERKHKFKTLTASGDKVGEMDIGIKLNGPNIAILIGNNPPYEKPANEYPQKDREIMMDLITSDVGFIFDDKTQRSILEIALRNNNSDLLEKLEGLIRAQSIEQAIPQQQPNRNTERQQEAAISTMSPADLERRWKSADSKGKEGVTTTRAKLDVESERINGMKKFVTNEAIRFVETFENLQSIRSSIKGVLVSLSERKITQEEAAQKIEEEKRKLEEIKAQQNNLLSNEKLKGFMESAQSAALSPTRAPNFKGKDASNPDQVIDAFAADGDGLILNTFKNIKTVRELTKGVDDLIKLASETEPVQKRVLAEAIAKEQEKSRSSAEKTAKPAVLLSSIKKRWQDADSKGEERITTTRVRLNPESININGMKDFIEGNAVAFVSTFDNLQDVRDAIKKTIIDLSEGKVSQEVATQKIAEEKRKLEEIKSQQASLLNNDKLKDFMESAQSTLSSSRVNNFKGKDASNPDQVINAFATDQDGLILNTFKNIKKVRELTKGVDDLLKIVQETQLLQKPDLAAAIVKPQERSRASTTLASGRTSRASSISSNSSEGKIDVEMEARLAKVASSTKIAGAIDTELAARLAKISDARKVEKPNTTPPVTTPVTKRKTTSIMEL